MEILKQLLGRLHPLVVHLPIGFILFGLLLQWKDRGKKQLRTGISLAFFWGGVFAVLACITGVFQYLGEGYTFDTIKWHLWSGVATALFCFLTYLRFQEDSKATLLKKIPVIGFSILLFVLVSVTGHLGGSITHGKDYLVEPLPNSVKSALGFEPFEETHMVLNEESWKDVPLYEGVIQPILNNHCVSCHNPRKSKGELQLDHPTGILAGGENGPVLVPENAGESELYKRLLLPKDDEHHMPPKEKKQPSPEEIELLGAWIGLGHPFTGAMGELGLDKGLLLSFFPKKWDNDYPNVIVTPVSQDTINKIKKTGLHIQKITETLPFLEVSCINKPGFTDADLKLLLPIRMQTAILDLGGTRVTDAIFKELGNFPNLTILKLDHTQSTGKHLKELAGLKHLKSINLTGSAFEERYFNTFLELKTLRKVYLYNTKIQGEGIQKLKNGQITVDYGRYDLPPLASDNIVY